MEAAGPAHWRHLSVNSKQGVLHRTDLTSLCHSRECEFRLYFNRLVPRSDSRTTNSGITTNSDINSKSDRTTTTTTHSKSITTNSDITSNSDSITTNSYKIVI